MKCPKCGSNEVIPIVYGYPSEELFLRAEAGKVKLGGCCVEAFAMDRHCKKCGEEWHSLTPEVHRLSREGWE